MIEKRAPALGFRRNARVLRLSVEFFLRAVGLELICVHLRIDFHKTRCESKNFIIHSSQRLTLSQCGVDILPIAVSFALLGLNWGTIGIGSSSLG